jgi:dienelactone hydrolase
VTRPIPPATLQLRDRDDYSGFDYTSPATGAAHAVYWKGPPNRPGVLLLHELPGLAKETVALADRIVAKNYRVFIPHLFGEPMAPRTTIRSVVNYRKLCVNAEFAKLAANVTAPIADWLRSLVNDISSWCNEGAVGAIGMCLTGGLVIPLMLEPKVAAPVMSQPAIPIPYPVISSKKMRGQLNVAPNDLVRAGREASDRDLTLLGFRFTADWRCPKERFDTVEAAFETPRFERHELTSPDRKMNIGSNAHSVLTYEYPTNHEDDNHPSHRAFSRMIEVFLEKLG